MEDNILAIRENDLDELVDFRAKSLVGKICKRFEIIENREILKKDTKELIYEEFRSLKELLIATGYGLGLTQFKLTKGKTHST